MSNKFSLVFFGSSPISVIGLEELEKSGTLPSLVVTKPDSHKGRGLLLTKSPVKIWAEEKNIPVITPSSLKDEGVFDEIKNIRAEVAILISYGKIIPKSIIDIFPKGILNLHPSLLPILRGPSPIETTILNDLKDNVGVSIMLLNEKMDEGPILSQKKIDISNWPPKRSELYEILSLEGGRLLAAVLLDYLSGKIKTFPQDDSKSTYCKIIQKEDALIDLKDDPYKNFLKIQAYEEWPVAYFLINHQGKEMRVKIKNASFEDGSLLIKRVIPEGRKEMDYESFLKGYK